jgi:hypothetical protein
MRVSVERADRGVGDRLIDHTRTSTWLYPGLREPAVDLPSRGPIEAPMHLRPRLVATFNSAFKLKDSGGGFAIGGHTYESMQQGIATFVRYRGGKVDVISWTGGSDVGPARMLAAGNVQGTSAIQADP